MLAAARGSDAAIIGDLLQAGASVNQTSVEKSTALMSAIADGGGCQKRLSAYSGDEKARCACREGERAG